MYNLNSLMKNTLITPEEVIFHAPTKHTLDSRMISSSIMIAEERFIRPEIGYEFYDDLCNAKNLVITPANIVAQQALFGGSYTLQVGDIVNAFEYLTSSQQSLWKQFLWKLVAECVVTSAYPEGFVQFGSEGALHNNPPAGLMVTSGFVTPLLTSMKWAVDKKVQDRIAPLIQSMHNYLCKNKASFPLYTVSCPDCDEEGNQTKYGGIALNIYDDDDDVAKRCCF